MSHLIQCFYIGQKRDSTVAAFQKRYPDNYGLQAIYNCFITMEGDLQLNPDQKAPAYKSYIVPADILLPDVPSEEDIIQIALATIQNCDSLDDTRHDPLYKLPWGNTRHGPLLILGKYRAKGARFLLQSLGSESDFTLRRSDQKEWNEADARHIRLVYAQDYNSADPFTRRLIEFAGSLGAQLGCDTASAECMALRSQLGSKFDELFVNDLSYPASTLILKAFHALGDELMVSLCQDTTPLYEDIFFFFRAPLSRIYWHKWDFVNSETRWSNSLLRETFPGYIEAKYQPKPDFRAMYKDVHLPFFVIEARSEPDEQDRWRLLAQCSRYLHLAKLLKLGEKLTLLAGYLRTDLEMEVYVMTLDPDDRNVAFVASFNLRQHVERCKLLLLFNSFLLQHAIPTEDRVTLLSRKLGLAKFAYSTLPSHTTISRTSDSSPSPSSQSSHSDRYDPDITTI